MKVLGLDNVFVPVADLARAVEFYGGIVGLPIQKRFDDMGMVLFRIGEETPGLGVVPIPTGWAFEVEDPWGNVLGFTDYSARPDLGRSSG